MEWKVRRDLALSILLFFYYTLFCFYFYLTFVSPEMQGLVYFRVGADSKTYIEIAKFYGSLSNFPIEEAISISSNLFGPVVLILGTNYNFLLIFMLNLLLIALSLKSLFKYYKLDRFFFLFALIINPITLASITTVNKEVLGLCGIIFFLCYFKSGKISYLLLALILSFFTRWQQFVVVLALIPYLKIIHSRNKGEILMPTLALLGASLIYPFIAPYIDFTGDTKKQNIQEQFSSAGGILVILNTLQNNFLYFIVFPVKALINYIGNLPRLTSLLDPNDRTDLYNRLLLGHQFLMFLLISWTLFKGRYKLVYTETQIIILYSIIYCVSLNINYRYFYPIYPLFIILALSRRK